MARRQVAYMVYHRECGHLALIANDREMARKVVNGLPGFAWRIRAGRPTDEEIKQVGNNVSCEKCVARA